jgi:hypothetical protein
MAAEVVLQYEKCQAGLHRMRGFWDEGGAVMPEKLDRRD